MFQFPEFPSVKLCIHLTILMHYHKWIPPFGYLRVEGYLLLTAAFRSLSRPSSAPSAKASALCSSLLDLKLIFIHLSVLLQFASVLEYICMRSLLGRCLDECDKYFVFSLPDLALNQDFFSTIVKKLSESVSGFLGAI